MTTFRDLIDDCESHLYSFGGVRDKVTSLVQSVTDADLQLQVAEGPQVDKGFVEIDREMLAVRNVDGSTGAVELHPWGRGQRGTVPVPHAAGARVVSGPRFPRSRIADEINAVVQGMYPDLFGVGADQSQKVGSKSGYVLPAEAESIISVSVQLAGDNAWRPLHRWRLDNMASPGTFPTGKALTLFGPMYSGSQLRVVYRRRFGTFTNDTDSLASVGLDEAWRDIVRMGVVGRMLMSLDADRLVVDSIEAGNRAQVVTPSQATQVGKVQLQLQQTRIAQERQRLLVQYPGSQVRHN